MKRIIFCFLSWSTLTLAQVQESNQIGVSYHFGYTAMSYQKSAENPGFNRTLDSLQTGGFAQAMGMTYTRRLTRELSLVSGLGFQNAHYIFLDNALTGLKSYRQDLSYIALPIGVEYNIITDKWQPFFGLTILTSKLVNSQISYILQNGWSQEQTVAYTPCTTWQISTSINIGAQLPVTLKWSIKPSVMLSYSINSLGTALAPQRPYQLAFQTAVLYNF
jgi:hypothetical protein